MPEAHHADRDHDDDQESQDPEDAVEQPVRKGGGVGIDNPLAHGGRDPQHFRHGFLQTKGQSEHERRDAQQKRDAAGFVGPSAHERRDGIVEHALLPDGAQHVARTGAAWAFRRAILTLVAEPDVRIIDEAALQPPDGPSHLFAWEGRGVRRKGTRCGTGPTLEALLQRLCALPGQRPNELQIRFVQTGFVLVGISRTRLRSRLCS